MKLFDEIKRGHTAMLKDTKWNDFEVKGAFWEGILIGLKFTQNGKKKGSPLMSQQKIKEYLSQFPEYSFNRNVTFHVKKFVPKISLD
jgi:hypothetical protein